MPLQKVPVRIYRDSTGKTGIQTTCTTAEEFIMELAGKLNEIIAANSGDDPDAVERWLRQSFEIVAKLKGYKADVQEERTLYAGDSFINEDAEIAVKVSFANKALA